MTLLTAEAVQAVALEVLRVDEVRPGRFVVQSRYVDECYARFGYSPVDYLEDPGAQLVGDAVHDVQVRLLDAAQERYEED